MLRRLTRRCLCRLILEIDAQTIAARVTMRGAEGEVPLAEQVHSYRPLCLCPHKIMQVSARTYEGYQAITKTGAPP